MALFWSNWSKRYWTEETIDWLVSDWKVNLIRASMAVPYDGYLVDEENVKKQLVTVVDRCIEKDVYVIIDWHIEGPNNDNLDRSFQFFAEMAQKYGDKPHVMFEGWNEPIDDDWSTVLKPYHEKLLSAIRPVSDNLYIAGNNHWSARPDLACKDRIDDRNVAYTVHFYAASHFAHPDRQWAIDAQMLGCTVVGTEWGICTNKGNGRLDFESATEW